MTCREMDCIITSSLPSSGFPPEAAEHIAECDRCWRLVGILDENCPSSLPSGIQLERIVATLSKDLAPVQPLARARVFFVGLALVFLVSVALGYWLLGTNGWRQLGTVQKIAVLVPQSACAGLLASSLVRLMVPGSTHPISPPLLPVGVLTLLVVAIHFTFSPHPESRFIVSGIDCMRTGLAYAGPAAAAFCLLLRCGAILAPGLTGATAGGLAGLAGMGVLDMRCPNSNAYHILIWHVGVALVAMAGGFAVGRLSNWRRNRFAYLAK
jgi:hypothetical protein